MDEKRAADLIRKFKNQRRYIRAFIVITILADLFLPINTVAKVAAAVLILLCALLWGLSINHKITLIAVSECDPSLYYAVSKGVVPHDDISRDVFTAQLIGDYKKGIELSVRGLEKAKTNTNKLFYMESLAKLAFESSDFEKCVEYSNKIKKFIKSFKKEKESDKYYVARADFYISFINKNYDRAAEFLDICNAQNRQSNSYKAVMQYYYGLVHYYSGKESRKNFQYVCDYAPKLKIAFYASEYIAFIDGCLSDK